MNLQRQTYLSTHHFARDCGEKHCGNMESPLEIEVGRQEIAELDSAVVSSDFQRRFREGYVSHAKLSF